MPDYTFPVVFDGARISSGPGARNAPTAGASTNHKGYDIAAPTGSPVVAPIDLNVTFAGTQRGYGNVIYGVDAQGNQHRFAHLSGYDVTPGQTVSQGQVLGAVGMSGTATGPHLHYEIRDSRGIFSRDLTGTVVSGGKKLVTSAKDAGLEALDKALESTPVIGQIWSGAKALGVPNIFDAAKGECGLNPVCHLEKWFDKTEIVPRFTVFLIGMVLIIGGIVFFAGQNNPGRNIIQGIAK